jgi:hypothetical protein
MKRSVFQMTWPCEAGLILASAMLLAPVPAGATDGLVEVVHVNFDSDTPGQPPSTGGPSQPTFLESELGTSILVQASANGVPTQPVVITAQAASQFASVTTLFDPVPEGLVRIEATAAFDRLADGLFLQTTAESGPYPSAVVTRLITTDRGEIQDDITRTLVGRYAPNRPFVVRVDIDMSATTWSVAVDPEMNGFDDNPTIPGLPFENPPADLPTVGAVWASLSLFPTLSVGRTAVAYDDIRVLVPAPVPTVISTWGRIKAARR